MMIRVALPLLALSLLSACNRPVPPAPDAPPEPQATQLRDAMQQPLDKAKAARAMLEKQPDVDAAERAANGDDAAAGDATR